MNISDFEDLGIISDFEVDEEANGASHEALMTPAISTASRGDDDRPHPPWEGHRDKLVGIVDMGRRVILITRHVTYGPYANDCDASPAMAFAFPSQTYLLRWRAFCRQC